MGSEMIMSTFSGISISSILPEMTLKEMALYWHRQHQVLQKRLP